MRIGPGLGRKPRSIKDLHRAVKVVAENTMNDLRPYRLVRERDLPTYAGLKRTQIAELIKRGEFPRPIRLSDGGRASQIQRTRGENEEP